MKTTLARLTKATLAVNATVWFLAVPVLAQQATERTPGGGAQGATSHAGSAPSGGSTASSAPASGGGNSQPSGGGSTGGGGYSGRAESGGSNRGGATGGSGHGMPRGGDDRAGSGARATGGAGATSSGGSGATSGGGSGSGATNGPTQGMGGRQGTGRATPRDGSGAGVGTGTGAGNGTGDGVPTYARPRDGHNPVGTAVPRGTVPAAPTGGGGGIYNPGYYGGYGYYDPWGYGYGDAYGGGYSGYYGGYNDPWYGGYPTYPQSTYTSTDEGSLKLKIKPRQAEVYVDGYSVGVVDDFDGMFQRLHLDSGTHRIEVRAPGFEPLEFEVRITPEHTTTYTGELKKIQ